MANLVLKNVRWYVDQYDLTGDAASHSNTFQQDAVENTTFGASTDARSYLPGLKSATHSASGFADFAVGAGFDALDANTSLVVTTGPNGDTEGNVALLYQSIRSSFTPLEGSVGGMAGLQMSGTPTGAVVGGNFLAAKAARTSSSNGTGAQYGTLDTGETLYAALHVFSGTASTLDVIIQSDDNSGFTTPTTRLSFTQATGATSQFATLAGPVATDSYWRAAWTVGGGTWTFAVAFGIQAS